MAREPRLPGPLPYAIIELTLITEERHDVARVGVTLSERLGLKGEGRCRVRRCPATVNRRHPISQDTRLHLNLITLREKGGESLWPGSSFEVNPLSALGKGFCFWVREDFSYPQ